MAKRGKLGVPRGLYENPVVGRVWTCSVTHLNQQNMVEVMLCQFRTWALKRCGAFNFMVWRAVGHQVKSLLFQQEELERPEREREREREKWLVLPTPQKSPALCLPLPRHIKWPILNVPTSKNTICLQMIWMWELDHKDGWVLKDWCFRIVVWRRLLRVP